MILFFFKQQTAYDVRISNLSSDVCSSDLVGAQRMLGVGGGHVQGERRRVGEVEDRQRGDFAAAFGGVDRQLRDFARLRVGQSVAEREQGRRDVGTLSERAREGTARTGNTNGSTTERRRGGQDGEKRG